MIIHYLEPCFFLFLTSEHKNLLFFCSCIVFYGMNIPSFIQSVPYCIVFSLLLLKTQVSLAI